MRLPTNFITESIHESEISELIEKREEVQASGDYDELYAKEDELVEGKKDESQDESSVSEEPSEEGEADESRFDEIDESVKDEEIKDTSEGDSDKEDPEEPTGLEEISTEAITESLRADRYVVANEAYETLVDTAVSVGGYAVRGAASVISGAFDVFRDLGITYGPKVLEGMKKTVVYIFTRSAKLLLKLDAAIREYVKRSESTLISNREAIENYRKKLSELKASGSIVMKDDDFEDPKLARWMYVNNITDPRVAIKAVKSFSDDIVTALDVAFMSDVRAMETMLDLARNRGINGSMTALKHNNIAISPVINLGSDNELLEKHRYAVTLPNRVKLVTELPAKGITDIKELTSAYQSSNIYLAPDNTAVRIEPKLNYMEPVVLEAFLNELDALVKSNLAHIQQYKETVSDVKKIKLGYRLYLEGLVKTGKEKTVHDTMVEYIHLKQSFLNRVYLPASIDSRDYISDFITKCLKFIELSMDNYEVDAAE